MAIGKLFKIKRAETSEATDALWTTAGPAEYRHQLRISELVQLARKAFAEKRQQECMALAKSILQLDPENDDARFVQLWIQLDLERELQTARALLPHLKDDETTYKEAQLVIQRVLDVDPENKAAEALRLEIDSLVAPPAEPAVAPDLQVPLHDPPPEVQGLADLQSKIENLATSQYHPDQAIDPPQLPEISDDQREVHEQADIQPQIDKPAVPQPLNQLADAQPQLDHALQFGQVADAQREADRPTAIELQLNDPPHAQPPGQPIDTEVEVHRVVDTRRPLEHTADVAPLDHVAEVQQKGRRVADIRLDNRPSVGQQRTERAPIPREVKQVPEPGPEYDSPADTEPGFDPAYSENEFSRLTDAPGKFGGRKISISVNLLIGCVLLLGVIVLALFAGFSNRFTSDRSDRSAPTSANDASKSNPFGTSAASSTGTLEINVDDGVDIFINDQFAGTTPIPPFTLKPGVYDLRYKFKQMDLGHETVTVSPGEPARSSVGALLGSLELFVVPASETVMQIDDDAPAPVDTHVMVRPGKHRLTFAAGGYQTQTMFVSVDAGMRRNVSAILQPAIPGPPLSLSPSSTPVQTRPQTPTDTQNNASSVATAKGTLAVSSLVPVEIYLDNNHVGTTPVTLELQVGTYTFEYRYGNLRKTSVNVIKSNEVTRATAAFDVSVQIISTPQAEVSLAGIQAKVLGQTPLGGVRVPIGSTLIFRASGYREKSYTVTEKDALISMSFP